MAEYSFATYNAESKTNECPFVVLALFLFKIISSYLVSLDSMRRHLPTARHFKDRDLTGMRPYLPSSNQHEKSWKW